MARTVSLYITFIMLLCASCIGPDARDNTPQGNFEALWKIIDEHYCFLDYKREAYGLDWDEVHRRYAHRIKDGMTHEQLFEVLSEMLCELRDGHVNLSSSLAYSQYREWYDAYPANYIDSLQRIYLGRNYTTTSGLLYTILDDNIGYVYCGSFSYGIGESNLDQMLHQLAACDGLIIDVRNNGGGNLTMAERLAARFTNERVCVGYMMHKTGRGRHDFSAPQAIYLSPAMKHIRWQKQAVVLTNRRSYSATNDFVCKMKGLPRVTIVGDRTGGGSGLPFSSELPNGWSVRFSAGPMLNARMQQVEFGIDPDVKVDLDPDDMAKGKDTLLERARSLLRQK